MAINVVMPKLGLTMEEGLITEWVKQNGDSVSKGDILFIMETEKITQEVESTDDGILFIVAQAQDTVLVGETVAWLLAPGEDAASVVGTVPTEAAAPAAVATEAAPVDAAAPLATVVPGGRIIATPLAKKLAKSINIDLALITGTGPAGRIIAADVEKAKTVSEVAPVAAPMAAAVAAPVAATPSVGEIELKQDQTLVPISGMRRAIAKNMLASKRESASTYAFNTVDTTKLQELRQMLMPAIEKKHGVRITVTDLMMKITAAALREHPIINTSWTEKGIIYNSKVHMGMAMALEAGLIVPVIKDIFSKSIAQISLERVALIEKGKTNSFSPDEISGSTFTLTALGMFGVEQFYAVINPPENAILAVGAIIDKPAVVNGEMVARPMMTTSLTYDHRVIDGAEAAKFLRTLKEYIENPLLVL